MTLATFFFCADAGRETWRCFDSAQAAAAATTDCPDYGLCDGAAMVAGAGGVLLSCVLVW